MWTDHISLIAETRCQKNVDRWVHSAKKRFNFYLLSWVVFREELEMEKKKKNPVGLFLLGSNDLPFGTIADYSWEQYPKNKCYPYSCSPFILLSSVIVQRLVRDLHKQGIPGSHRPQGGRGRGRWHLRRRRWQEHHVCDPTAPVHAINDTPYTRTDPFADASVTSTGPTALTLPSSPYPTQSLPDAA